eukprot:CAMPEP_0170545460 /NCGR_PEP_ID=MMETSP0211-20121228/3851_1 /TAXON_ID=311385 /ORGANISM="Pseudokeronopsis sp., Strain OXSARD2" /LENGTH=58 /DNA_ID=CAMNT_0010849381 /DNA_START=62 /DNA_END=238 /DNA_ORIENTATION=-
MTEEKQTSKAIAFAIDISHAQKAGEEPDVKKRLEQDQPTQITMEQIEEKLRKAQEKRK